MNDFGVAMVVLVFGAIVILSPFVSIWALNTLFGLGIEFSLWTWLAGVWLHATLFRPSFIVKTKGS